MVEGHSRNLPVNLFHNRWTGLEEKSFKGFFSPFLALAAILLNGAKRFEQFLVDSHIRNIPMKLFQDLSIDIAEEVFKSLFLFIALTAILFHVAESFEQFW